MKRTTLTMIWTMALAVLAVAAPAARATALHFHLVKSMPRTEAMLETAPTEIKLWFSEEPQEGATSLRLVGPGDEMVELGEVARSKDDASMVFAKVSGQVPMGVSKIMWRAMGRDGHVVRGEYTFSVHSAESSGR